MKSNRCYAFFGLLFPLLLVAACVRAPAPSLKPVLLNVDLQPLRDRTAHWGDYTARFRMRIETPAGNTRSGALVISRGRSPHGSKATPRSGKPLRFLSETSPNRPFSFHPRRRFSFRSGPRRSSRIFSGSIFLWMFSATASLGPCPRSCSRICRSSTRARSGKHPRALPDRTAASSGSSLPALRALRPLQ